MTHYTTRPKLIARLCTIALWAVGSAYLYANDRTGDPVVIYSVPVVWAVVITLPILATYARRDRQFVTALLLWIAALAGCAYTLQATIGRQAETRDVRVMSNSETDNTRRRITMDLTAAKQMLEAARAKCGTGKVCHASTKETIAVYEGAVAGHEARLADLRIAAPDAGERRIARLLAIVFGMDARELVELIIPCLFGLVLELATFAAAMYAWHPVKPMVAANITLPPLTGKRHHVPANEQSLPSVNAGKHPVIAAIEHAGRSVSNRELAKIMGVCDGEATKRRREVASLICERRIGKHVMITLA